MALYYNHDLRYTIDIRYILNRDYNLSYPTEHRARVHGINQKPIIQI